MPDPDSWILTPSIEDSILNPVSCLLAKATSQQMANGEGQTTTDQGQKAKRKYTVSDKVRAANRINLEKARSVDKAIRYRPTEKRLTASRANLEKGRQSANYKPYVRHGLRAVDLRQSAPLVVRGRRSTTATWSWWKGCCRPVTRRSLTGCGGWPRRCGGGDGCL